MLLSLLGAGQAGRSPSPPDARQAIIAAEDGRLALPDGLHTPAIDLIRAQQMEHLRTVIELTRSAHAETRRLAIRALGRYERRELTSHLIPFLSTEPQPAVVDAIGQSMQGDPLPNDPGAQQLASVLEILRAGGTVLLEGNESLFAARARALGRLPYTNANQVRLADAALGRMLAELEPFPASAADIFDVARGLESLARRHMRLTGPGEQSIELLRRIAASRRRTHLPPARVSAMAALVAARGVDAETLRLAAAGPAPELRRLAAISLAGAGSPLVPAERTETLITLLSDSSAMVRLEALRAWVHQETPTNGCDRVLATLNDRSIHVVLAAIDALADACPGDVNVADRLVLEARTPPRTDNWHRQAHALVALAKRAPDRLAVPLLSHVAHPVWQVRMYAGRAAAIADDVATLERLGLDPHHNVREATLGPLRRLQGQGAEPFFLEALKGTDYQLLRTAAIELKGTRPSTRVGDALADALKRITAEEREVSRDTRSFRIALDPQAAPLTSVRFMRLVKSGFYDGLSFHRVVPNFVVQGGSPGANEYAGEGPHMRDEISAVAHARGTVGLSTRGRDTGDMQFFINLVDNARLDFDYTVFGRVMEEDLHVVDTIVEGTRIVDVAIVKRDEKNRK